MTALLWLTLATAHAQALDVGGACPGRVTLRITDVTPGASLVLMTGTGAGEARVPEGRCAGVPTGLAGPLRPIGRPVGVDGDGSLTLRPTVPVDRCDATIAILDLATCAVSPPREMPRYAPVRGDLDLAERADASIHGDERLMTLGYPTWVNADDDDELEILYSVDISREAADVAAFVYDSPTPGVFRQSDAASGWLPLPDHYQCGFATNAVGEADGRWLMGFSCQDRSVGVHYYLYEAPIPLGAYLIGDVEPTAHWTAPSDRFNVSRATDLNGDGLEEVALIHSARDLHGLMHFTSELTTDGPVDVTDIPWQLDGPDFGTFGEDTVLMDYTGDGLPDIAAAAWAINLSFVPSPLPMGYNHTDDVASGYVVPEGDGFDELGRAMDAGESEGGVDANGDGLTDLLAGAEKMDDRGAVYLFTDLPRDGATLNAADAAHTILYGTALGGGFGVDVALARDIDGDGHADLVATASGGVYFPVGDMYVFYGPTEGVYTDADADAVLRGGDARGVRTLSVADANRDGYSDIAVGAEHTSAFRDRGGAVFVFFGGPE